MGLDRKCERRISDHLVKHLKTASTLTYHTPPLPKWLSAARASTWRSVWPTASGREKSTRRRQHDYDRERERQAEEKRRQKAERKAAKQAAEKKAGDMVMKKKRAGERIGIKASSKIAKRKAKMDRKKRELNAKRIASGGMDIY